MMNENISAISTAAGVGGVAIIRVSGDSPLEIAEKMFRPLGKTAVKDFEPYKMYVGEIVCENFTDFGMCVFFKGPKSYTGEDMVEFHCHGGVAISQGILHRTFTLGARPATNGEFTQRAFLNGKMSLASCEGLIDMINSESVGEVKAGYYLYREKLTKTVKQMQDKLTYVLAEIDASIDYPEEGIEEAELPDLKIKLSEVKSEIESLIGKYQCGRKIKNGVKVAIVGKPNTGKSSILNAMLNYDKAIVSSIAGTTRDVVEGCIDIKGIKFNLFDTAGIRESTDEIEAIGISRSKRLTDESDLILFVVDGSGTLDETDKTIYNQIVGRNVITVVNKSDLGINSEIKADVVISAKNDENIDELKELMYKKAFDGGIDLNADFLTEERHLFALKDALSSINTATQNIGNLPLDLISIDIKNVWDALGAISGETANENIIDEIFKKFCVGK